MLMIGVCWAEAGLVTYNIGNNCFFCLKKVKFVVNCKDDCCFLVRRETRIMVMKCL